MSIASDLAKKTETTKAIWSPPVAKSEVAPAPAVVPSETLKGPAGHTATIIKQTDPSQKFAYLANCTCQFQGRAKTEVDIKTTVQRHFERYE